MPQASPVTRLLVRGVDLPIYLAVLWWMGSLWQWVETADGAVNVTPAPTTSWIGGALALGLLGLAGWYALRGRTLPQPGNSQQEQQHF